MLEVHLKNSGRVGATPFRAIQPTGAAPHAWKRGPPRFLPRERSDVDRRLNAKRRRLESSRAGHAAGGSAGTSPETTCSESSSVLFPTPTRPGARRGGDDSGEGARGARRSRGSPDNEGALAEHLQQGHLAESRRWDALLLHLSAQGESGGKEHVSHDLPDSRQHRPGLKYIPVPSGKNAPGADTPATRETVGGQARVRMMQKPAATSTDGENRRAPCLPLRLTVHHQNSSSPRTSSDRPHGYEPK